jgi:hypothetical protein
MITFGNSNIVIKKESDEYKLFRLIRQLIPKITIDENQKNSNQAQIIKNPDDTNELH